MPRYRITLEYDGTPFVGWQAQTNGPSVQGALEVAIEKFTQERVRARGAGRTDTGVHALGQVSHFDLSKEWDPFRISEALNFHLKPAPISVVACEHVSDEFDARFSATARHYLYRILNRRAPPALKLNRVWPVGLPLNAEAMHEAAQALVGHHDFTTFRAAGCQANSPLRTMDLVSVSRVDDEIHIRASARSFLHSQVRSFAGSLKLVGEGKWMVRDVRRVLDARDRAACGALAPPCGLYLARVDYSDVSSEPSAT